MLRVISGTARGLKLAVPVGLKTRPTADRVKEALFSILTSRRGLADARILDICAGTGSLGIEALSRGAASCVFIEQDRHVMELLQHNLDKAGMARKSDCLLLDAQKALNLLARRGREFDIVFFDPPYQSNLYDVILPALLDLSLLTGTGMLVAECSSRSPLPKAIGTLSRIDRRVYGDTALEIFAAEAP